MPRHPSYPYIDRRLGAFRAFGIGVSVFYFAGSALLWFTHPELAIAAAVFGVVFLLAHLALPLSVWAWRLALAAWGLTAAAFAAVLARTGWPVLGAIVPALGAAWMWRVRTSTVARLEGREPEDFVIPASQAPRWGPCVRCGSRESEVVAPIFCMSVVSFTARWPGDFRSLCLKHARVRALGAVLFSAVFGWWGIPWGPIWTADALSLNLSTGGATLESDVIADIRRREREQGGADDPTPVTDFGYGILVAALMLEPFVVAFC